MEQSKIWQDNTSNITKSNLIKARKIIKEHRERKIRDEIKEIQDSDLDKLSREVLGLILGKRKDEATERLTEEIKKIKKIFTTRSDEKSEMWVYLDGIYVPQGRTFIREYCRQVLGKGYTIYMTNQVIAKIEADTYISDKELFSNNNIEEIPVLNGVLNILIGKLRDYKENDIFFNKLPIKYESEKDCPNIIKHFKTVLKNEEDVRVMQELFGYLLYKENKFEKAVMFNGFGRNGKGKTIELMKRFLGAENCVCVPLQELDSDHFSKSELLNKMANLAGDCSAKSLVETNWFKMLTGRDPISAAVKFKERVHFTNFSKQIFSCNKLPRNCDDTDAFWERWVYFEFPYRFVTKKDLRKLSDKEKENCKIKDPDIIVKISTDNELSGLLNWALVGLHRLLKNGDFSDSKTVKDIKELWIRKSDSFKAFCMDCLKEKYGCRIDKADLRRIYSIYCRKYKLTMRSDKSIKYILTELFGASDERAMEDSVYRYYWNGIKYKQGIEEEIDGTALKEELEGEELPKKQDELKEPWNK